MADEGIVVVVVAAEEALGNLPWISALRCVSMRFPKCVAYYRLFRNFAVPVPQLATLSPNGQFES